MLGISGISGAGFVAGICIGTLFLLFGVYLCVQNKKADSKWSLRRELKKSFKPEKKKDEDDKKEREKDDDRE